MVANDDETLELPVVVKHNRDGQRSSVTFHPDSLDEVRFDVPRQSAERLLAAVHGLDGSEALKVLLPWIEEHSQNKPWSSSYAN